MAASPRLAASPRSESTKENEEIVFLVEVLGVRGLTKPERTSLQLTGFGIEGTFNSLPLADESTEPSGWLFLPSGAKEEVKEEEPAPKAKAKAPPAKGKDKTPPATAEAEPPPPAQPPQPIARLPQPCGTSVQRQRLLDVVCGSPIFLDVMRQADPQLSLGRATVHLPELIHDSATVECDAELVWSPAFMEEWTAAQEAAEAEAAAAAAAAAGSEGASATPTGDKSATPRESPGGEPEQAVSTRAPAKPPFAEMRVRISTAGPIGRVLCPEDLEDWAALTVNIQGCYSLPQSLLEVGGPLPTETFGVHQDHPLTYSIRFLGCKFDNGNLILPEVPPEPEPAEGASADAAAAEEPGESAAGDPAAGDGNLTRAAPAPSLFEGTIGKEEFVEGLVRAGFRMAHECAAEVFDFVDVSCAGVIGREDFTQLADVGVPAEPAALVALCETLMQKSGQLDEAFSALDETGEGCLTVNSFRSGLEAAGQTLTPEEIEPLFVAMDTDRAGVVVREGLKILGLHRRIAELRKVEKVKQFLFESFDSVAKLTQQLDDTKSGVITVDSWKAALQRLTYPEAEGADPQLAFDFLDLDRTGSIEYSALEVLEKLDVGALTRVLPQVQEFLMGTNGDAGTAMASLSDVCTVEDGELVSASEFAAGCKALGYTLKVDPRIVFALLDEGGAGRLGVMELTELIFFNTSEKLRRLASCRTFMEDTFGNLETGFGSLFDDQTEFFKSAEDKLPRVEFPEARVCVYRGRAWLQQLLNTLNDARGRRLASKTGSTFGGAWLYFYPLQKGNAQAVDFKDIADPAQSTQARVARWHQAQAFVDMRRLSAPVSGESGPEVEFQAFLSQIALQPKDITAPGDLPKAPFGTCRMYVKGSLQLDRPLVRLSPRDIRPLPQTESGEPLVPPPPEKAPPPSASEELEMEAHRAVNKLVAEFKKMCHEQNFKETRAQVRPEQAVTLLLGHGVHRGGFLTWLEQQDNGGVYRDLSMELRRAVVRYVKSEHKDAPSCGLTGTEKDAMYTGIRTILLKHFMRALNNDVNKQQQRRDGNLWKNVPVTGDASLMPQATPPAESAAQQRAKDSALRRLVFEYELCGNVSRAGKLFDERLALPQNVENPGPWYDYARFLMRCGQRQLEAEKALRYAISLRPAEPGPTIEEVAFLACMMQNYQLPCSLSSSGQSTARFEAAISLLANYADQHPLERAPLFFMFIMYGLEAWAAQAEADAAAAARAGMGMSEQKTAARPAELRAMAAKYLELARVPQNVFDGTLGSYSSDGMPTFPELETLVRYERVNRKEIAEPTQPPAAPEAWQPVPFPALTTYSAVHSVEDSEDSRALSCIDLMLHFGLPSFVRFLIVDAPGLYGFLTPATAASERCRMQLVKALMLQSRWVDAVDLIEQQFQRTDRICAAHHLLGECHYHLAQQAVASSAPAEGKAKSCFEKALSFLPEPSDVPDKKVPTGDAIVHFRIANMHYASAEASNFTEMTPMEAAMEHYKQSLLIAQTAEVWWRIGVCAYRIACFGRVRSLFRCKEPALTNEPEDAEQARKRQLSIREASRYLVEANLLDVSRPQINAWLAICAVEMGQTQVAKQALRQLLRYEEQLDADTALELAQVLLRFSDESRARQGERKRLVQDARYASEVIAVCKTLLSLRESGEVHYILGLAYIMLSDDATALPELEAAHPCFSNDPPCQDEIAATLRACATRLNGGAAAKIGPVSVPEPPPRTPEQEEEFRQRLECTRLGDSAEAPPGDFANFSSGFEVYDHDLPEILEAVLEGQVEELLLSKSRLGPWGLREVVARLRESPSLLQRIDMSNCACVGEVGKELVNSFPYSRGCCLETSGCGLPEEDVIRLRNRTKEAGQVMRQKLAAHARSRELCEAYNLKQDVLEQIGVEVGTSEPPPPPPLPSHHPHRWVDGLDTRARLDFRAYKAANPDVQGNLGDDRSSPFVVVHKTGESQTLDDDHLEILNQKRAEMLEQAGFAGEEEEGEYDDRDEVPQRRRGVGLPEAYTEIFGQGGIANDLIAFMLWNGVRVLPEEIRTLQRRRSEMEAEQKRLDDEYEASEAELRRRREEIERAQARLRAEMEAEENRKVEEWEAAYRLAAQAKTNLSTKAKVLFDSAKLPMGLASGQLIAHFTYLCKGPDLIGSEELEPPSRFGLKRLSEAPRPKPRRGHDLHEALLSGKVMLQAAEGRSYGQDALMVTLQSATSEPLEVTIRRGTIFQHVDWVHRQNLLVAYDYLLSLPAGGVASKKMMAYCMNVTCSCSAGDSMQLTEFYIDEREILESQAAVWDHFESSFSHAF